MLSLILGYIELHKIDMIPFIHSETKNEMKFFECFPFRLSFCDSKAAETIVPLNNTSET